MVWIWKCKLEAGKGEVEIDTGQFDKIQRCDDGEDCGSMLLSDYLMKKAQRFALYARRSERGWWWAGISNSSCRR